MGYNGNQYILLAAGKKTVKATSISERGARFKYKLEQDEGLESE